MSDEIEHPLTFAEAEKVNAYELARRWGGSTRFPARLKGEESQAERELEELAVMAALRRWLERWTPAQIHRALLAGASVDQVAAAAGMTPDDVAATWRAWDVGQRQLWQTYPDMDKTAKHDQVEAMLRAAAGT
jgi:hypothetical protein